MKYQTFYDAFKNAYTHVDFTNEHGERFKIIRSNENTFITGDEFDWDVHKLFNEHYSDEEIRKLGEALIKLSEGKK